MAKVWVYFSYEPDESECGFNFQIKHVIKAKNKQEASRLLISYEIPGANESELNRNFEYTSDLLVFLNSNTDFGVWEYEGYPRVSWQSFCPKLVHPIAGFGYDSLIDAVVEHVFNKQDRQLEIEINKRAVKIREAKIRIQELSSSYLNTRSSSL